MRNPFRSKNLNRRFVLPLLLGLGLLAWSEPNARTLGLGAPLVLGGLFVRGWAVGHLVKTVRFTVTGPYAYIRHPLYLGTLAIGLGMALMLGGWAAWLAGSAVVLWFLLRYLPRKERIEGDRLERRYGEAYARYRREVPALFPRLHAWRADIADTETCLAESSWRFARFDANNELGTVIAVSVAVSAVWLRAAIV